MNKKVSYRILIKSSEIYYKLGTIILHRFEGDIWYAPSNLAMIISDSEVIKYEIVSHVSWHKSGRVHIKGKSGTYYIFEEGTGTLHPISIIKDKRQEINDIGFQEIIRDTVMDIKELPEYKKNINPLDVVLNIKDYSGAVKLLFAVVSGTHIVRWSTGKATPVKLQKKTDLRLDSTLRALGWESENADKLLQYALYKYVGKKVEGGRALFIARDAKIKKIANI